MIPLFNVSVLVVFRAFAFFRLFFVFFDFIGLPPHEIAPPGRCHYLCTSRANVNRLYSFT